MAKPVRSIPEVRRRGPEEPGAAQPQPLDFVRVKADDRFAVWDEFLTSNISRHIRHPSSDGLFFGEMSKQALGLITDFKVRSSPYTSMVTNSVLSSPNHRETYILIVPALGQYALQQDGHPAHLQTGDMALLDSRLTGSITGLGFSAQTMIAVQHKTWEEHALAPVLDGNFKIETNRVTSRLARAFLQELEAEAGSIRPDEADLLSRQVLELLSLYFEGSLDAVPDTVNKQVRIRKLKSYVRDNLEDPNLGPSAVADHFNISKRYISRLFEESGLTLMDYVQQVRLQRAAELLIRPAGAPVSIKAMSYGLGFRSPSHFSTRFSEKFGMSPSEYRKRHAPWRNDELQASLIRSE